MAGKGKKPAVYDFKEFKDFFTAYTDWLKTQGSKYSLRWVAKRLGLKSHAHLVRVGDGTKLPNEEFLEKFAVLAELNSEDVNYLKLMIAAQAAKTLEQKDFIRSKTETLRRDEPAKSLETATFDLISDWYLVAVMELSMIDGFSDYPKWIAARLRNSISEEAARRALERLEEVQLLKRDESGSLRRNVSGMLVENKSPSQSIRNFHRQMLTKAEYAMDNLPPSERLLLSQTFRFDPKRLTEAEELIVEFRRRFQVLLAGGQEKEVYHLAIQFFPLTSSPSDS